MVFEHLFPEKLLEKKHWTAFFLAIIYTTISIVIARLVFGGNSGLVSVFFTSIFLLPYFQDLLKREEKQELREKRFTFKRLFRDNFDMIQVYFFLFFGIYLTYLFYSFLGPFLGYDISVVFREQLSLEALRGGAIFSFDAFAHIMLNNWWVLLATFLIALVAGDGAVFFVAWNASVWGTIFGYRAVMAASFDGSSALFVLLTIVLITLPHVILEGSAYILAAISGAIISDEIDKPSELKLFVLYFIFAAIVYYVLTWVVFTMFSSFVLKIIFAIGLALAILYLMHMVFDTSRYQKVFKYNYQLFVFALIVFAVGAIVEVLVLSNATVLTDIYAQAFLAGL